jgi:excisionase family DNA binding protein
VSAETVPPLLTVAEVAERLRLGRSTIYRLVADGEIDAVQIGRAVRFEPAAVDFFISRKRTRREASLKAVGG